MRRIFFQEKSDQRGAVPADGGDHPERKDELSQPADTDFQKTTAEVLDIYRRRDVVEKCFDDLKNEVDMKRLYVQSDAVAEGKAFAAFLALIVRSRIQNVLRDHMVGHKLSFKKLLLELDKAKLIASATSPNRVRLLNPATKTQREILQLLGIPPDALAFV